MGIISVRENPEKAELFIDHFVKWWASDESKEVYRDCIENCLKTNSLLPQWYLMMNETEQVMGGVGLVTNDFISRMDLWPWLCALYVEEPYRNNGHGARLLTHGCTEARRLGFDKIYLSTDHIGYYEKHGFSHIGDGYHPWGASSRIYERSLTSALRA